MSKKIITLIAVAASINALAQKDTLRSTNLDEVVITATKFPIKTSATGKVVTIITQQQLEQSGGKDLSQILAEQSSLVISGSNSNASKDKTIYLRGADARYTLITIDGVPVSDPSGVYSNFDIRNLSVNLVERIEILKGSQSTLYGTDAIAGVINIITKKATGNKQINTNGLLSYGSNNSFRGNLGVAGKAKAIDYNVGYSYNKTDGISEAVSTNPNADKDRFKQEAFNANFGFAATNNIIVKPFLRYGYIKGDIDNGAFTDGLNNIYSQKSFQTGVRNELSFGETKLNVLYSYNKIERLYNEDSRKAENGYEYYSYSSYSGAEHFVDVYSNFSICKSTKLTVGADYRNSKTGQNYYYSDVWGPYTSSYSSDSVKQHQTSVYAVFNYADNAGFNFELGGRYNNHSTYGSNWVFNFNPSYQVTSDIKIFANISSGYRTPSLDQLYSPYGGNKNLKPEVSVTSELGLEHYFNNKTIKNQFVVFSRNIKDVQIYYAGKYLNRDEQKDFGFEFETSFQLEKNTTFKTFYTFVDGIINTKNSAEKDTSFHNLLKRPKHSVGANLSSKITSRLLISINATSQSERNDAYYDNATFKTVSTKLESYALLDVYAEYAFLKNKLKLFVNARNITDTKYTEASGYNTLGRNIYGGVRFNF